MNFKRDRILEIFGNAKISFFAAVLALGAMTSQLAFAQDNTLGDTYSKARGEGKLVLWSPWDPHAIKTLNQRFGSQYAGVTLETFELQEGASVQRAITESQAGQVNYDLVHLSLSFVKPMTDRGLLQAADWEKLGVDKVNILMDGRCISFFQLPIPIAYNTSLVSSDEITGWESLLEPKWKGRVALETRGWALGILKQQWGEQKTAEYIDRLKANGAILIKGGTPTAEALASGQAALAIGTYTGKMIEFKERGAPVDWARVGPLPAQYHMLCLAKNAKNPNAARLYAAWITTQAGQDAAWAAQKLGNITGSFISPVGSEISKLGIPVVMEDLDPVETSKNYGWVASRIGGF